MSRPQAAAENRFSVRYLGREFRFCRRSAMQELEFGREAERMCAHLAGLGIPEAQKQALAANAVLLWQALDGPDAEQGPEAVLRRFSMGQIADLVRLYFTPEGEQEPWFDECGVNQRFLEREGDTV